MDTDNVDLQIQDVDTGYQNNIEEPEIKTVKKPTPYLESSGSKFSFPWDKLEMLSYLVISVLVIAIVGVSSFYIVSRMKSKQSTDSRAGAYNQLSSQGQVNQTYALHTQKGIEFSYPGAWLPTTLDETWAVFDPQDSNQQIHVFFIYSEYYLNKEILAETQEFITQKCIDRHLSSILDDCNIQLDMTHKIDETDYETYLVSIENYVDHKIYITRLNSNHTNVLVLLTPSEIPSNNISNLINSIAIFP